MATDKPNAIPNLAAITYHCLCMAPWKHDEEYFGWLHPHMGHLYAHFVLWQDEKCANLATAQHQMATDKPNAIPNLAAKAYHCLCMSPRQQDEEYFGW